MVTQSRILKSNYLAMEVNWEAVYAQELPRVYNFFRYRFGDGQQAEDLTATTFEKAWRARRQYRQDKAAVSTWLFTIARNVATDYVRQQRSEVLIEDLQERATERTTEEIVRKQIDFERLEVLLARLPARDRELVALKYGAALSNRAIAQLIGLSESNVGTILYRLVQTLRTEWERKS